MAMGDVIARMALQLTLDAAALAEGADMAEKRFNEMRGKFEKIGAQVSGIGKKMSIGITAPIVAAGVAMRGAVNGLVDDAKEMRIAADVAGEGFESFQRLAYGAQSVGIEADKLGDIFKDVRDKIGDFQATGAGPMADFFENIAPKVGLAKDAFVGLSGKDGLQLYYNSLVAAGVSSSEMAFYMEAIASDATNLIPLLQDSGKAFDELGDKAKIISKDDAAQLQAYADAGREMDNAMRGVTIAIVNSGLLDAITELITGAAAWVEKLGKLNPDIIKWGVAIAGVAAAIGPVLVALGSLITIGAPLLSFMKLLAPAIGLVGRSLLLLAANPVVLGFAAVLGGIYLAWKNWDTIGPIVQRMVQAVKTWVVDRLGPILRAVLDPINAVKNGFRDLYIAVVGNSYVPDMVDEIGTEMKRLDQAMVDPAAKATKKTAEKFRELAQEVRGIMARLFPEVEQKLIYDAERKALESIKDPAARDAALNRLALEYDGEETPQRLQLAFGQEPLAEAKTFGKELEGLAERTRVTTVKIGKSFKDMADDTMSALNSMVSAIKGGGFLDILQGVIGMGLQLGSIGVFGKGIAANINKIPGYANGTTSTQRGLAMVGEYGPELVQFSGGQRVYNNKDTMGMMGGKLDVRPSPLFEVFLNDKLMSAAPSIIDAGANAGVNKMAWHNSRRLA